MARAPRQPTAAEFTAAVAMANAVTERLAAFADYLDKPPFGRGRGRRLRILSEGQLEYVVTELFAVSERLLALADILGPAYGARWCDKALRLERAVHSLNVQVENEYHRRRHLKPAATTSCAGVARADRKTKVAGRATDRSGSE